MFIEFRPLSLAGVAGWLNENKITPKEIIKLDLSSDGRCLYCLAWKPDESQKEIDDTQELENFMKGLYPRTYNIVKKTGVKSVTQLVDLIKNIDFFRMEGVGNAVFRELRKRFDETGIIPEKEFNLYWGLYNREKHKEYKKNIEEKKIK